MIMKLSTKNISAKYLSTWVGLLLLIIDAVLWIKNAWDVNNLTTTGALILAGLGILGGLFLFAKIKTIDEIGRKAGGLK